MHFFLIKYFIRCRSVSILTITKSRIIRYCASTSEMLAQSIEKFKLYQFANKPYANHPIIPFLLLVEAAKQFQANSLHYYPLH